MSRRRRSLPKEPVQAHITDLTHEGKGVTHIDGKTVFINQALPGEDVEFIYVKKHRKFDEGRLHKVINASDLRIEARCEHFYICGGCSLQHVSGEYQIQLKQKILIDNLKRIGHVESEQIRSPLTGPQWGYRRKARLGVKYVEKKQKVLIGFREKGSGLLAELNQCEVLHPAVGKRLTDLAGLIRKLSCFRAIPQIEVAVGDSSTALVIRHLEILTENDRNILVEFAKNNQLDIYLQSGGPDTILPLWPQNPELYYTLEQYNLRFDFLPADFVQVNSDINKKIIPLVIEALNCHKDMHVLELFCGLGNFTLPIARHVASVTAVEGEAGLIERAKVNAKNNDIKNVAYYVANLMEDTAALPWWKAEKFDCVFVDPPRSGAENVLAIISKLKIPNIVYVSCNPATLARDAGILVNDYGYKLLNTGVMDMFPHTAHVESIAVFKKE
jgi:23S rRNA (uracil1939-C5)-methyltransferase